MMWWRLKRHHLAVVSGIILALMYFSVIVSEVLAPYDLHTRNTEFIYAPPQEIHLFHNKSSSAPSCMADYKLNMENLRREYTPNLEKVQPIRFL